MELENWRKLDNKQIATKITEIVHDCCKEMPEHVYLGIMNASKVMYDRSNDNDDCGDDDQGLVITRDTDPVKLKFELEARRRQMREAKKNMRDFKPLTRVTNQLKEMAIESYCKHVRIRIPVHTWACLDYYGYASNIPVREKEMYRVYKEHHNLKLRKYEEMYKIEMILLDELEKTLS
jgi:hypothetical protein